MIDHGEPVVLARSSDGTEGALLHSRGAGEPVAAVADDNGAYVLDLQIKAEVMAGRLQEAVAGRYVDSLRWGSLSHCECVGPLDGAKDTTALSLLFVANSCIVNDGVRIVNAPAVQVGRAGGNLQYPLLVELACLRGIAEFLHPGVIVFNCNFGEAVGLPFDSVGSITQR